MLKRAGRVALFGVVLALLTHAALAQESSSEAVAFSVEPQPLYKALNTWAKQARLQLIWPVGDRAAEQISPRVVGRFLPREALEMLLKGSALEATTVDAETVGIRRSSQSGTQRITWERDEAAPSVRLAQAQSVVQQTVATSNTAQSKDLKTYSESESLDEVVVTGTHIRGAAPTGSSLTVYRREEIDRSGAGNVEQFLRTIPQNLSSIDASTSQVNASGRDIASNAWFGATVNLHGLGSGATLILLNGQRIAPAGGQGEFVDVSLIPLSAVERIEVLSDGASAIYGSDAVAGVVNFILRKDYQGAETNVRYGDTTDGGALERTASQLLGTRWDGGSTMLVYEYQDQNPLLARQRDFVPISNTNEAGTFKPSGAFTLLPQQRRNSALVTLRQNIGAKSELSANGFWSKRQFDQTSLTGGVSFGETYITGNVEQIGASLGFTHELPGLWNLEATANQSRLDQDQVQRDIALDDVRQLELITKLGAVDVRATGPLFDLWSGKVRASVGVAARREGVDATAPRVPHFVLDRDVLSAYGELLVPLVGPSDSSGIEKLMLSLSARYDRYSDFGSATQPKIGIAWSPFDSLTMRGSYSRSYKAPTLSQLHESNKIYQLISIPDENDDDGYINTILINSLGNANLQPERARSFALGLDFKPHAIPGVLFSMTYFNVQFSDRISPPPLVGTTFDIYKEPAVASFISRDVTQAEIDRILSEEEFENFGGPDFTGIDPHLTEAFYTDQPRNIAVTKEAGADFSASYAKQTDRGTLNIFLSGTKLFKMDFQVTPTTPPAELLNKTFRPMDLRLRTGASWTIGGLTTSMALNYSDSYEDNLVTPTGRIDSWLTADLQIRYAISEASQSALLRDTTVALSVLNATNEDPPSVQYGGVFTNFNYDSANASARGRFIALQIGKQW